jgi:hypothetical protein
MTRQPIDRVVVFWLLGVLLSVVSIVQGVIGR